MRMWWRRIITVVLLGAAVYAAAVFSGYLGDNDRNATRLEYRLKWLPNAGFVGDLYASAHGLYTNAGLQVQVSAGGPNRDALTALLTPGSRVLFGVASADQVLQAAYRGSTDLRVVAQIYAANPVQWIYRSSLGPIDSPEKLKGKRIGVSIGDNDEAIMKAYLDKNGISQTEVTLVGIQFDYAPFLSGAVDLFAVYSNTQGVELRRQMQKENVDVSFFDPSKIGSTVQFAANSIVTTQRTIQERGDMVQRFVEATIRGWDEAIEPTNRDRASRTVVAAVGESLTELDTVKAQIEATFQLIKPTPGHRIGTINVAAWQETEEILYTANMLKGGDGQRPAKKGVTRLLTTDFLPAR